MKRDLELCREILRLTEESPEDQHRVDVFGTSELEGYTSAQIGYHVYLLQDAGLLEAWDARSREGLWTLYPRFLTMAGHDFLEATRNETVWKKTLSFVQSKGGSVTLDLVREIASGYLRTELGL